MPKNQERTYIMVKVIYFYSHETIYYRDLHYKITARRSATLPRWRDHQQI